MERVALRVEGMTCGHCEAAVQKALVALEGVHDARADHTSGKVDVDLEGALDVDAAREAISEAGYTLLPA